MKSRVLIDELMDDPNLHQDEHYLALRGLQRINAWSRNAHVAWRPIAEVARQLDRPLRILDIATGAADRPITLHKRAAACGVQLDMDACDVSATALKFASENCTKADASVRLFQHDVLQHTFSKTYDVVMCSQFLHHLTEQHAAEVLVKMMHAAERRVIIVDVVRNRFNWLQVWCATRALSRSRIVRFDGPQSIRAACTVDEMEQLARRAGLLTVDVKKHWPCRCVFVGDADDDG